MEKNNLKICPGQYIAIGLKREDPECKFVQNVISKTMEHIEIMEDENLRYIEKRKGSQQIDPAEIFEFLRSQERIRNTKYILQYLTSFFSNLPLGEDIETGDVLVNPFDQIKSFTLSHINLMEEQDVNIAILREYERLGLLTESNRCYYQGQIDNSHKTLVGILNRARLATVEDYRKIFFGLQRLCDFWFSVRNEEIQRVRKSDIFIYQLTRYLLEKYI